MITFDPKELEIYRAAVWGGEQTEFFFSIKVNGINVNITVDSTDPEASRIVTKTLILNCADMVYGPKPRSEGSAFP